MVMDILVYSGIFRGTNVAWVLLNSQGQLYLSHEKTITTKKWISLLDSNNLPNYLYAKIYFFVL